MFLQLSQVAGADDATIQNEIAGLSLIERVIAAGNHDKYDPTSVQRMKAAWESIGADEMTLIADELAAGKHRGSFWVLRILAGKMAAFDQAKVEYNREACVIAILDVLESETDEGKYSQLLLGLGRLNDSRIMSSVEMRDGHTDSSAVRNRAELMERWRKQVNQARLSRRDRGADESLKSSAGKLPPPPNQGAEDPFRETSSALLIASTILAVVGSAWVLLRFRRTS